MALSDFIPNEAPEAVHVGTKPGVLLVATVEPGVAAVFRVFRHPRFVAGESAAELAVLASELAATAQWLGWYSSSVVANAWEPYDQPHPAAYMPLSFEVMDRLDLARAGTLLRQVAPEPIGKVWAQSRSRHCSCAEEELPEMLHKQLRAGGFAGEHIAEAVRFLLGSTASAVNAA